MSPIKIFFDGLCEPVNPKGVAVYAFIAFNEKQEEIDRGVDLACKPFAPLATNNFAEYTAVIKALEWAVKEGIKEPEIYGDSKVAINQTNGSWKVKSPNLFHLVLRARNLKGQCGAKLTWIPREQNHADKLTQEYYEQYATKHGLSKNTISKSYSKYRDEMNRRPL